MFYTPTKMREEERDGVKEQEPTTPKTVVLQNALIYNDVINKKGVD
jgi:hypothetical protein